MKHDDGDTDETDAKDAPATQRAASVHYGFGLEFELLADGTVRSAYKEGINTGSSAMLRHYPDPAGRTAPGDAPPAGAPGVTVAVVCNAESDAWEPVRRIDAMVRR